MAIPTTTYDIATATNPTSALTDFTFMIDLSRMSAAWWAEVDTSDGTRGRASKNDGITELATDWIDFDDSGETGWLRVKWTGTLASSGTQIVRVYPPNTGNTAYGVSDTYGQYNAYDSDWLTYWAGLDNRISASFDLTAFNSPSVVSGKVGNAYSFNGSTQYLEASGSPKTTIPLMMLQWIKHTETTPTTQQFSFFYGDASHATDYITCGWESENLRAWNRINGALYQSTGTDYADGAYHHIVTSVYLDGLDRAELFVDGSSLGRGFQVTPDLSGLDTISIARAGDSTPGSYFNGEAQEAQMHGVQRSDDYISQEYSQTNDNATFWGTWTNVPVGPPTGIIPNIMYNYRRRRAS